MSKEKQNSIDKVLNDIDRDELGEIMMDKAESLQMEFGDCSQIYSSFLYCNGEYVWGGQAF